MSLQQNFKFLDFETEINTSKTSQNKLPKTINSKLSLSRIQEPGRLVHAHKYTKNNTQGEAYTCLGYRRLYANNRKSANGGQL